MVVSSRFQVPRRAKVSIAIVSAKYLGELDEAVSTAKVSTSIVSIAKVSIAVVSAKYLGELDGDLELDEVRRWEIARAHCTWGQQYVVMVRVRVRVRGTSSPSEHVR